MKVINKVELKLDNYDKCNLVCDSDCPLGQLYDYSCALKAFIVDKMQAAQQAEKPPEPADAKTE